MGCGQPHISPALSPPCPLVQVVSRLAAESRGLSQDWAMGLESGGHDWAGPPFTDPFVTALRERLEEVCADVYMWEPAEYTMISLVQYFDAA